MKGTTCALRHWMDKYGRLGCGSDGLCLSVRLVTFVLEHIDEEAHRGVFVHVGERVTLVVICSLSRLLQCARHVFVRSRVCTLVMGAA
jgi:hypothetical protein